MTLLEALDTSEYRQAQVERDGYTAYVQGDRMEGWNELSICKEGMPPHYVKRFWTVREVLEDLESSVLASVAKDEWEPIGEAEA